MGIMWTFKSFRTMLIILMFFACFYGLLYEYTQDGVQYSEYRPISPVMDQLSYLDRHIRPHWIKLRKQLLSAGRTRKVLLVSYMRGGSTIAGEIFGKDPRAVVWHEPLAAFYQSYYGVLNSIPQSVLFDDAGHKIVLDDSQLSDLNRFIHNTLTCDYLDLPPEGLTHPFLRYSSSNVLRSLMSCKPQQFDTPTRGSRFCRTIQSSLENGSCFETLPLVKKHTKYTRNNEDIFRSVQTNTNSLTDDNLRALIARQLMLNEMKEDMISCIQYQILDKCRTKSLQVIKANRIFMSDVAYLLYKQPDLFVIHVVRDPRPIAMSRMKSHLCSNKFKGRPCDLHEELVYICKRLEDDLHFRSILEHEFPDSITELRYDDIVQDPINTAERLYKFLGVEFPGMSKWVDFSEKAFNGMTQSRLTRVNGSESLVRWKTEMDANTQAWIQMQYEILLQQFT